MLDRQVLTLLLTALALASGTSPSQAATKPNVVLITLGSVRADRMSFLGSHPRITPHLDEIARHSLIFERAFSQSPLTVVSQATILTGTFPQAHRISGVGMQLPDSIPFLPAILRAQGYRTAAFVGSIDLDPKNGLAPGFDRGFSTYNAGFHRPEAGISRYQSVACRGNLVVSRAISWLNENAKVPFFLWLQLDDANVDSATSYAQALAADDAAVGQLISALQAHQLYDEALVAITSDHGQSLGAHGEQTHGVFLYDESVHVPLLLKLPGAANADKRVAAAVSLVDLAPTVLELARVPVPSQMQGESLMRIAQSGRDEPVYARSDFPQTAFGWSALESWRVGKYLYIRAPKPELYNLFEDPGASRNLAQSAHAVLETMAAQMTAFDQRLGGQSSTSSSGLTSSEVQKLASLGYVGLQKSISGIATAASGIDPKDEIAAENGVLSALAVIDAGKPERALSILRNLDSAASDTYLAQFAMGIALREQRDCANAIKYLHRAIEFQPDSSWAHFEMGFCLTKTGDYKSAAVHLEIASKRLPEFSDAHALLAQTYDRLGRPDDAKRERIVSMGK